MKREEPDWEDMSKGKKILEDEEYAKLDRDNLTVGKIEQLTKTTPPVILDLEAKQKQEQLPNKSAESEKGLVLREILKKAICDIKCEVYDLCKQGYICPKIDEAEQRILELFGK